MRRGSGLCGRISPFFRPAPITRSVAHSRQTLRTRGTLGLTKSASAANHNMALPEGLRVAQSQMAKAVAEKPQGEAWDSLWKDNITPWDAKKPAPPLVHLLETTDHVPDSAKVLVPGCGSAYDVIALAGKQRFVVGLDISETAAAVARKNLEAHGLNEDKAVIRVADFFTFGEGPFDVIYDYTFLAALPPHMRNDWATGTARLLAKDGKLITLIFPLGDFEGGPPFAMSYALVEGLLKPLGFEAIESGPAKVSHPARQDREWVAVWQRKPSTGRL